MKEYRSLAIIILAIFTITLLGAYYSPTFEEQKSWLELFFLLGSLLFIFSALVIFATIGFGSFSIYGAIFLASVMGIYGITGAVVVVGMTYLIWGFIFAMEFLLVSFSVKSAIEWFQERYTYKSFYYEYRVFYPMLIVTYIFLETIPNIFYQEKSYRFSPSNISKAMRELLD